MTCDLISGYRNSGRIRSDRLVSCRYVFLRAIGVEDLCQRGVRAQNQDVVFTRQAGLGGVQTADEVVELGLVGVGIGVGVGV